MRHLCRWGFQETIQGLPIPQAGKYLLFAKIWVSNTDSAATEVRIDSKLGIGGGGGDLDNSGATLEPVYGSFATISHLAAWEFTAPGSVDLFLLTFYNTAAEAANIRMSAIRVDNLTAGTLP